LSGGELISKIIEGSETFQKRTKFSQEKYLRKKMQKYLVRFEVKKATALELCEAYNQAAPNKIQGLRSDSLGLMLQLANICSESHVLLIDKTRGLLAGALIEKHAKEILSVELAAQPQIKISAEILMEFDFHPY